MKRRREMRPAGSANAFRCCLLNWGALLIAMSAPIFLCCAALAQADQGAITGTVFDQQGAVVPNADVTVTDVDTGFAATAKTNASGTYVISPLKIGHYTVTCASPGFQTENHPGLMLNVQQRLGVDCHMAVGQAAQTVTVRSSDRPLLQTEDSSTGQVVSSAVINETPLNQRNYVFIAQLSAGVEQTPSGGSRGQANGDFDANGQRPDQNDFILDGVDNNSSAIDFLNGASYTIKPPPDALAEFKVQTGDYSAELGHSAGAVLNASIKSGTNNLHGDLWEYFRNDALDARSFNAPPGNLPEYRQNQFGATIGGPVVKNHLFFFGDFEANRIIIGNSGIFTVPTALMRQGNFTELLNPSNTGYAKPDLLYQPGSGGSAPLTCNGQQNVFCANQMSPLALKLLSMFPAPNYGAAGQTYNNLNVNLSQVNNTAQWDGRVDWNVGAHDQAFARLSLSNNPIFTPDPFGVLDGGGYGSDGPSRLKSEDLALSETHIFSPAFSNEVRFSFEYGAYIYGTESQDTNVSANLGLGGIPYQPGIGGVPWMNVGGLSLFGATCCVPVAEHANNGELIDNVTKIVGNHALKMGFQLQLIRSGYQAGAFDRGWYQYNGLFTSTPGVAFTGYGVADFLADMQYENTVSNVTNMQQYRWYRAGYVQDDWKVTPRLTVNLGLRYDHFDPFTDKHNAQANFNITAKGFSVDSSGQGHGTGTALYEIPKGVNAQLNPTFTSIAAKDNLSIVASNNPALANAQKLNFAPRIGFAFSFTPKTVVRAGYGIFYGGLQNGFGTNVGMNYPFQVQSNFYSPTCPAGGPCTGDGFTLEDGWYHGQSFSTIPIQNPSMDEIQANIKTPYTQNYNLSVQRALSSSMTATLGYVGATARHLQENNIQPNAPMALATPGTNTTPLDPFPDFGSIYETAFIGSSNYNSLQTTLEKHYSNGLYFLAAYTWSHSLDDDLSNNTYGEPEDINIIPLSFEYGTSDWDVRNRFTLNANYQLPVGQGRQFLNRRGVIDEVLGGWAVGGTFVAQSGNPISILANSVAPAGGSTFVRAIKTGDPFKGGGSPNSTNPDISCPARVKTVRNWFNPCAFSNPRPGSDIAPGQYVTSTNEALEYYGGRKNQINGPGFNRLNTSLFKRFSTFEGQYAEFRADIFNTYNSTAYGQPNASDNSNGGLITGTRALGANSPDGRFIQLALKYIF